MEVPFRVAMLGGKVPVTLPVTEPCPTCAGSGGAPGATWSTCPECNGRGTISFGQGGFAVNRPCPQCRGRGRIPSQPCPTCHGAGEIRTERRVMITVPPATETGTRVRIRGQGQPARPGAPAGRPHRHLPGPARPVLPPRRARHRRARCRINMAQATLGTRLRVRTLDGKKVMLRIPPGTQPGRKFRIKGQGMERNGVRGDQLVQVQVTVPEQLTPEQQELLKKIRRVGGAGVLRLRRPASISIRWRRPLGLRTGRAALRVASRRPRGPRPAGCPATSAAAGRAAPAGAAGSSIGVDGLDPAVEVARHPVGRADVDLLLAAVAGSRTRASAPGTGPRC